MVMKHYPPEFRAKAVALYWSQPGATIKSVADDLGMVVCHLVMVAMAHLTHPRQSTESNMNTLLASSRAARNSEGAR
jgi:transposase